MTKKDLFSLFLFLSLSLHPCVTTSLENAKKKEFSFAVLHIKPFFLIRPASCGLIFSVQFQFSQYQHFRSCSPRVKCSVSPGYFPSHSQSSKRGLKLRCYRRITTTPQYKFDFLLAAAAPLLPVSDLEAEAHTWRGCALC